MPAGGKGAAGCGAAPRRGAVVGRPRKNGGRGEAAPPLASASGKGEKRRGQGGGRPRAGEAGGGAARLAVRRLPGAVGPSSLAVVPGDASRPEQGWAQVPVFAL